MGKGELKVNYVHLFDGPWKPYRGKYPDPTLEEYGIIHEYLKTFHFEKDDFVEDDGWRQVQEEYGVDNLHQMLLDILRQIRETKGYDVEHYFSFFAPFDPYVAFTDENHKRRSREAAEVAIATINAQMLQCGKSYELVSLDKCVWTFQRLTYLMTLTVKEVEANVDMVDVDAPDDDADDSPAFKTIRAMVYSHFDTTELVEWKFKS